MKIFLKIISVLTILLILFRGIIFRSAITYKEIGTRPAIELSDSTLISKIEKASAIKEIDLYEISKIARKITNGTLKFRLYQTSNDPNELIYSNETNCVGYSAMFNSIANHLIRKHNLQYEIKTEHKIGQLELFGIDIHEYFDDPFFKDHDFNILTNKTTGEQLFIDPSVSDYFWINRVSIRE